MRFPAITGYRASTPVKSVLTQGAYVARSLIAEAQRCINLYPELNPPDAPFPTTHYPTPGLALWSSAPSNVAGEARGIYYSTRGILYAVVGENLYTVNRGGVWSYVGTLATRSGPVAMVDNGNVLLVADGPTPLQAAQSPVSSVQLVPSNAGPQPPITYWGVGNVVQLPGLIECSINTAQGTTGNQIYVLALAYASVGGNPYGYAVGFFDAAGVQCGQIFKVVNGALTSIGTFNLPPNPAALPTGVHTIQAQFGSVGQIYLWIDGLLAAQAQDTTYSLSGQLWYGTPTTLANTQIAPIKALNPSIYIVNLATQQFAQVGAADIYGATHLDYLDTFFVLNYPGTQLWYATTSNLTFIDTNSGPIETASITAGGAGYADGTYNSQALTGGNGSGATANITVAAGAVTAVSLISAGTGYQAGDVLSAALPAAGSTGGVQQLTLASRGAGLLPGTYTGVPLAGGTGSGALATIVVGATPVPGGMTTAPPRLTGENAFRRAPGYAITDGPGFAPPAPVDTIYSLSGVVISFTVTTPGSGYTSGDVLTPDLAFGTVAAGELAIQLQPTFRVQVINPTPAAGFTYTVSQFSNLNAFNALAIAAKTGFADELLALIVVHREVWLFGRQTTEVWSDAGGSLFPFALEQGVFIQRGILAPYSLAKSDLSPLWLGRDQNGGAMVFQGLNYNAVRVSTSAIEQELQQYARLDDAVGFVYQQGGHIFYVLNFPTADRTWVYDLTTQLWHQRATVDGDGTLHRHLPGFSAFAYGMNLVQRWDTGDLLIYDTTIYNDLGNSVMRVRGFPHIKDEMRRIIYNHFIADMEVGQAPAVSDAQGLNVGIYPVLASTLIFALLTTGAPLANYQQGASVGLPGQVIFDVELVAGSVVDVLLFGGLGTSGTPNGYIVRVDSRVGEPPAYTLKVTNGEWGSFGAAQAPYNTEELEGLHHVTATLDNLGNFTIAFDNEVVWTGNDTTYVQDLTGQVYLGAELVTGSSIAPSNLGTYPLQINLHWSDDGGQTWGAPLPMALEPGAYNQLVKWNRLGMGRDRVFEIFWTTSLQTALNGAWISTIAADS